MVSNLSNEKPLAIESAKRFYYASIFRHVVQFHK